MNILETRPPGGVRGVGSNVVAVVADLPWGPAGEITEITSNAELFDTFCPLPFDALDDYVALKAFINKTFPNSVKVYRTATTSQAAATFAFQDDAPTDSVDVTAKYPGALGNSINVAWSVNADDADARDATVTIGTTYTATYEAVCTLTGGLSLTDPGDPYVTFALASGATDVPEAIAATALASGSDGTAVAGDYTDGVDAFADANVSWSVGFVAEPPSALIDSINAALEGYANTHKSGYWVLCTPPAQAYADTLTDVADYRTDRTMYVWPLVKTVNTYDPNRAEVTVQGNSFAACAIASVDPEVSPGGAPGAPFLRGITGLEQAATITQLNNLNAAGVSPFFMSTPLEGAILHNAVNTTLVTGLTKTFRRRMTDYLVQSIAGFLEQYTGTLLDIDLVGQALGPNTSSEFGQVKQFLADLETRQRIKQWDVDPFGGNVQSNIDAGQWVIILVVKLYSAQEQIVLKAEIGETVQIEEA